MLTLETLSSEALKTSLETAIKFAAKAERNGATLINGSSGLKWSELSDDEIKAEYVATLKDFTARIVKSGDIEYCITNAVFSTSLGDASVPTKLSENMEISETVNLRVQKGSPVKKDGKPSNDFWVRWVLVKSANA